jgi:hypothetical protein
MKQPSLDMLIAEYIAFQPGVTSDKLWNIAKEWDHKLLGCDFDDALGRAREKFRVTNKQWYPPNYVAPPKVHSGRKEDPRQTRMDW